MTKASDNPYPSLLIEEGTEPSAPAAGHQRLYIDSTSHHLSRTDSSGTEVDIEGGGGGGATMGNVFVGTCNPHFTEDSVGPNVNNQAWYAKFRVDDDIEIDQITINILASSGNIDLGVYNAALDTLLVSTGSTASPGTGIRNFAVTPTTLAAGTVYYAAIAVSAAAFRLTGEANNTGYGFGAGWNLRGSQATAMPLPATPGGITWDTGSDRGWPCILFQDAS